MLLAEAFNRQLSDVYLELQQDGPSYAGKTLLMRALDFAYMWQQIMYVLSALCLHAKGGCDGIDLRHITPVTRYQSNLNVYYTPDLHDQKPSTILLPLR